jgi:cyclic beta-1,2-glucan synthetase
LEKLNMLGRFGFYEAIDYTKSRLPAGQTHAIVQSYMAHHQGMILLAASNYLSNDLMVQRFQADEHIQSVELLLQEKIPQNPPIEYPHSNESVDMSEVVRTIESAPWSVPVESPTPIVHVLAQGDTSLLITNAGSGYSQWREFALTRWHADTSLDGWGTWVYVQDRDSGALWSATCQPFGILSEQQKVMFFPHKVEFLRTENDISLRTVVTISTDGV